MTESGPLASPYARQALSYAFDYDAFIKGILHGYGRRAYGPIPSSLLGYDPHAFHYQTDLGKARALLQKAGVKQGTTLTMVYTTALGPGLQSAGLILEAQLAQIGLRLKLQQLDSAAYSSIFFSNEAPSRRPNVMNVGWYPDYNDPYDMCVPLLASYSAGAAGANTGYYHNKQVDALLAAMKNGSASVAIRDAKTLQDIAGRVDPPAIWLSEPAQVAVMRKNLQGYVFNPLEVHVYNFYPMHR